MNSESAKAKVDNKQMIEASAEVCMITTLKGSFHFFNI